MEVKAYWMKKDYTWKKSKRTCKTKEESKELADEVSRRLNRLLNSGFILDYRVEY